MAAINVSVGGDTRQLERDIQKTVNKAYNINLKTKANQPLGRITGQVNEFTKSLDASNARVIAFGASAGIIFGVERALGALASSAIEVQKSLQDINVILNVSVSQLNKFGSELFSIAKNTGQSFGEVAKAATEFSRQGLGVEETLKRTNQALILSRLSGLDAAKSVEALTAAVNSYASQAVTASEVVNKFANVDAAFAVSSADLADALARVGSSAAQSGVSLNELIAIVTAAQQTTARGGAVIGNSFKTIFTRLQRGKVVDLLENLGISTKDNTGQIKSTIQLLQDLAKTYDQLGSLQQADVAEKVGGVFQINILKAALADLGKEYSIYNNALQVAASSSDQAIRRNEELNQTYAAQINILKENAKQLAASAGQRVFGPAFERVVGGANQVLGGINESEGNDYGSVLGKGILDGLGQVIAGPGLALLGGIFAKLFADLSKFAVGSAKDFLGLNNAAKQQAELQRSITDILSRNPALIQQMGQGTAGVNKLAETLLATLRAQTVELQKQQQVAAQVASILAKSGVRVQGGVPTVTPGKPGKAAGYIPNFVATGGVSKRDAFAETIAAYQAGYEPKGVAQVDGKIYNKAESVVQFPGAIDRGIVPPKDSAAGKQYRKDFKKTAGYDPYEYMETGMAKGFVPNFASKLPNVGQYIPFAESLGLKVGSVNSTDFKLVRAAVLKGGGKRNQEDIENDIRQIAASRKGVKTSTGALRGANRFAYIYAAQGGRNEESGRVILTKNSEPVPYSFTSIGTKKPFAFEDDINQRLTPVVNDLAKQILPQGSKLVPVQGGSDFNQFIDKSAFSQIYGRLFEAVVNRALGKSVKGQSGNQRFEFFANELSGPNGSKLSDIFSSDLSGFAAADLKFNRGSPESTISFIKKMAAVTGIPYDPARGAVKLAASGFVPNFAALQDAIKRERSAGVPSGQIYVAQDKRLAASGYNPFGLGVFNTRDEPNSGARSRAITSRGYSGGYIPNFVQEDTTPADLNASVAAIVTQLGFVAFALSGFGNQYKQSLQELTTENQKNAQIQKRTAQERRAIFEKEFKSGKTAQEAAVAANYGPGGGQKFGAAIGAGGAGLAIGAPIIAQTIANAIGQETKNARVGSATASAFGDIGSFAGTGALVAGPKGAAVGALIGALTGLTGVIKQLSTDIPELSAKAKESASNLTQFNEASQRTKTAFEQLQDLRSRGQAVEAGKAEGELLKNIAKDFAKNPQLRAQATSAVINKDFAGLQQALDRNSEALLKLDITEQKNLAAQNFIEKTRGIGTTPVDLSASTGLPPLDFSGITGLPSISKNKQYSEEDLKEIRKSFTENIAPFSALSDRRYDTGLTPDKNENRKLLNQAGKSLKSLYSQFNIQGMISEESRSKFLDLVQPGMDKAQKQAFLEMPDTDFVVKVLNEYAEIIRDGIEEWKLIDKNTGRFNKEVQNIIQNIGDVKSSFDNFAQSASFAVSLQADFNNALSTATAALESAKLGNFADVATQLGDTGAGRRYSIQSQMVENQQNRDNTINTAFARVEQTLTDYLIQQAKKTQEGIRTTADTGGGEDPLKIAQKAQAEIRGSIETLIEQLSSVDLKPGDADIDPLKSVEDNLKTIFDKLKLPEDQQAELGEKLREPLQNLLKESILANTLLKQQNTLIAEQKVGEVMKEFAQAAQQALGGRDRFTNANMTYLNPFLQAIGDLINLDKGVQGREIDIEQGRASLILLDEINKIVGRNIIPGLSDDNPLKQSAIEGLSLDIFDQLKTVFDEFKRLSPEQLGGLPTDILKTLGEQVGISGEEINAQIASGSIDSLIDTIADKLAAIQVGGKIDDQALQGIRENAIDQLVTEGSITAETANNIRNGLQQSLSVEALMVTELTRHTGILQEISNKLNDGGTKKNEDSGKQPTSQNSTFDLNTPAPTLSKGFIPSFAKEMNSIRKGVGGAKGTDYPLFVPNLNGEAAWINSGEKLIPNFANTGETAVLTREMQKALNFAEGYIPSKEMLNRLIKESNIDPDKFDEFQEWAKAIGGTTNSEKEFLKSMEDYKAANLGFYRDEYKLQKVTAQSKQAQKIEQLRDLISRSSIAGEKAAAEARLKDIIEKTSPSKNLAIQPSTRIPGIDIDKAMAKIAEEEKKIASQRSAQKAAQATSAKTAKTVAAKGATKTILKAIPGLGAVLGLGEGAYRAFQGDYTGAALAAGAGIAGIVPGWGSAASIALSAALIAKDLQAAGVDSETVDTKLLNPLQLDTLLKADKTIQNGNNLNPSKLIDEYIQNPGKLMLDSPETFDMVDKSVRSYLENPTGTLPTRDLYKEIFDAFNSKDPELIKKWIESLGYGDEISSLTLTNKDVWDRIADKNGGWDQAISNKKLPMAVRMGLWNRLTGSIPRTGRVITVGFVNGPDKPTRSVTDAIGESPGGFFAKDNVYVGPSGSSGIKNMIREMNYVKPDGTILHYRRVRPGIRGSTDYYGPGFRGDRNKAYPLRLVSATRPPNQEYVTEGTSNDVIGVKNGNETTYYTTADAPLGGLGKYKGKKVTDQDGNSTIYNDKNEKVGSSKSWANDPKVKSVIDQGGSISDIEKAVIAARESKRPERIIGGKGDMPATQITPEGVGTQVPVAESVAPPPPKKETTVEEVEKEEKEISTKAKGYVPSFAKEMRDIRKGVGGAIPTDTPLFVPNLNGEPAVINSGEKLIPNFAGTGETAVLTREMQKMMSMAKGYVPNFNYLRGKKIEAKPSGVNLMRGRRKLEVDAGVDLMRGRKRLEINAGVRRKRKPQKIKKPEVNVDPSRIEKPSVNFDPSKFKNWDENDYIDFLGKQGRLINYQGPGLSKNEFPVYVPFTEGSRFLASPAQQAKFNFREWMFKSGTATSRVAQKSLPNYPVRSSNRYDPNSAAMQFGPWDNKNLPMAVRMGIWNNRKYSNQRTANLGYVNGRNQPPNKFADWSQRAYDAAALAMEQSPLSNGFVGVPGPARTMASNLNYTMPNGRTLSYIRQRVSGQRGKQLRLSSVTRPQNERYVTEGTRNDTIESIKGNVTEYYGSRGSTLGGLGAYQGRKITDFGPAQRSMIENTMGEQVGSISSLSYTPEVQKAIATGNISEIEKATRMARDRISSRNSRLNQADALQQANMSQQYFKQDLADKIGGIATGGTQAEMDEYYKTKAKEAGMEKEYLDYIQAKESEIVEQQKLKSITESRAKLRQSDKFIQETDAYLMNNKPNDQYLKDRQEFIKAPTPLITPPPISQPINTAPIISKPEDEEERFARGYIPNFGIDPAAISEAKIREKREAGPNSIPTFSMYNGKPMVYDARTQTPASAIRDHAFEGGYDGVVKRQFGADISKKNIVANMAMTPQEMVSKSNINNNNNNPVFNINFSPQTTYSSQRNNVPNFASVTKKYDAMLEDMRGSLKTVWDKYNAMENITESNIREGNLKSAPPRTKRQIQSIKII